MYLDPLLINSIVSICSTLIGFSGAAAIMLLRDWRQDRRGRRERERNYLHPIITRIQDWAAEVSKVTFDAYFSAVLLSHILLEEFGETGRSGPFPPRAQAHQKELSKLIDLSAKLAREPPRSLSFSFDATIAMLLVELLQMNGEICALARSTTKEAIEAFMKGSQELEHIVTGAEGELDKKLGQLMEITAKLESRCRHHLVA